MVYQIGKLTGLVSELRASTEDKLNEIERIKEDNAILRRIVE